MYYPSMFQFSVSTCFCHRIYGPTTYPLASPGDADSLGSGDPHW